MPPGARVNLITAYDVSTTHSQFVRLVESLREYPLWDTYLAVVGPVAYTKDGRPTGKARPASGYGKWTTERLQMPERDPGDIAVPDTQRIWILPDASSVWNKHPR